jgi:hypothetical protein
MGGLPIFAWRRVGSNRAEERAIGAREGEARFPAPVLRVAGTEPPNIVAAVVDGEATIEPLTEGPGYFALKPAELPLPCCVRSRPQEPAPHPWLPLAICRSFR